MGLVFTWCSCGPVPTHIWSLVPLGGTKQAFPYSPKIAQLIVQHPCNTASASLRKPRYSYVL